MVLSATAVDKSSRHVIGIAEMRVSKEPGDVLVTYALGSCVGVSVYDPVAKVGGLIHCMLPSAKLDPEKAKAKPFMFTDTGVVELLQEVMNLGGDRKRLVIKVAGAGAPMDKAGRFKIGDRNLTMVRKVLWKNDLLLKAEETGGTEPKTMSLFIDTGVTTVRKSGKEYEI